MKSVNKKVNNSHESKSSIGMGDGYGTGIKQPIGKIRDMYPVEGFNQPPKNNGKPPKSFA